VIVLRIDLVFEGGGILGITFVGAYKALIEKKYEVVRCAGTSAGSIVSALIIAGYRPEELAELIAITDFKQFLKKTKLAKTFLVGKLLSLIVHKGIYNSNCIEKWIYQLLAKKGIKTFRDIMVNDESPLKIIVADVTKRKMLILPDDLKYYHIKPEDFLIAKAVRMSCTIPYFYTPLKMYNKEEFSYCVDGGLLSTYPIWVFDIDKKPLRPVIGFKIQDKVSLTSLGKKNIFAYTQDIIDACINKDEMMYVRTKALVKTILINHDNKIKATDFKLDDKAMKYLSDCGYIATNNFFNDNHIIF
jgi:NTE family protein